MKIENWKVESIENTNHGIWDYVTKVELFACYGDEVNNEIKVESSIFIICLLLPLAFAGLLHFCLASKAFIGLTIGLVIGDAEYIGGKVTDDFMR